MIVELIQLLDEQSTSVMAEMQVVLHIYRLQLHRNPNWKRKASLAPCDVIVERNRDSVEIQLEESSRALLLTCAKQLE